MQNIQAAKASEEVRSGFPTWMIIKLGTGLKTADDFRKALKQGGYKIGGWCYEILDKPAFTAASKETKIELVKVTNAKLGFKDGGLLGETYKRALEFGLELCPNEVGPPWTTI